MHNLMISMRKHSDDFVRSNIVIGAAYIQRYFLSLYYKYLTNVRYVFKIVIRRVSLRGMELYINNENASGARETANYMYFLRNAREGTTSLFYP